MKHPYVVERILDHYPHLEPAYIIGEVRRCSFVSLEKQYVYYQVPKAACTQIKDILRTIESAPPFKVCYSGFLVTHREMFIHARVNLPLPSLVDLDDKTQREVLESPNFLRMTVVRNPYKRLISAWRNKVLLCEPEGREVYAYLRGGFPDIHSKSLVSFDEFIGYLEEGCDLGTCNDHWRRQADHIFFPALNFSHIGKVDRLGDTLRRFERHVGLSESLFAPGRNVSAPVGHASYTPELAETVYRLYRRDFEVFGYNQDSWPRGADSKGEKETGIPEQKFLDEIVERNLVILGLYQEHLRLQTLFNRVSQLHLLPVVNGLVACGLAWRRLSRGIKQWTFAAFRPNGRGGRPSVTSA